MTTVALTIAGSDPSGGAGLQADLKTFHQHGVYGLSVVTLLTVQNTEHVESVQLVDPAFVLAQLGAVLHDLPPAAAKTGALGSAELITALAAVAAEFPFPLVVDPVMISKHGDPLLPNSAVRALRDRLLPHARLVTPNRAEAAALAEIKVTDVASATRAAAAIARCGVPSVLIKGVGCDDTHVDLLYNRGDVRLFAAPHVDTPHTHGSGCVFSAAITARLAAGTPLTDAIAGAKDFIARAIQSAPGLGHGRGPVNMHTPVAAAVSESSA
jgi:hydroxymethylpyrimidine/phosphomethylpyrimidine kinase